MRSVSNSLTSLFGGVVHAAGDAVRGVVHAANTTLPGGMALVVAFVVLLILAWNVARR